MHYRPMTIEDYDAAVALWLNTQGVLLRDADSREGIARYLQRNPGLSFVVEAEGKVVGTIMGGHDSHRGFIQHLAVAASHRNMGIGSKLVTLCLDALKNEGIQKSHLMLLIDNEAGRRFWSKLGWEFRTDIALYSFINGGGPNA
ncbi:GNAT family N-acetyltransferase [Vreelandella populi]|uniref:GNAT family N-acetyltransferase n=1 Tax=Vreelandella populi TaxID=2498858 RepID=UPI000F8CEBE4|nr:GNAT family N-acetyltransferase [Halomonas populi]RUR53281.1 GNAT family N-acetyltransferase [Halomonas populi]